MKNPKTRDKNQSSHVPGFETLPELLDQAVERHASRVAMKSHHPWGYQSITYREMGRLVSYLGTGLIARGLKRHDRVALIADNSPEWALLYAAVTSAGGVIVPLETGMKENEIRHLLLHSGTTMLVVSPALYADRIEGMRLQDVQVFVIGEEKGLGGTPLGEVMADGKQRINDGDGEFFNRKSSVSPDDIAAICYTSGTTGQPKGVVLLHRNLISNVKGCIRRFKVTETDSFLCLLPLYHTLASTTTFLVPVAAGCTVAFARSLKSRDIREDIEREGITIFVGVPLLFEHIAAAVRDQMEKAPKGGRVLLQSLLRALAGFMALLSRIFRRKVGSGLYRRGLSKKGLGSIRFCISGAAALRRDVEQMLTGIGLPVLQGYGLTEASPVVTANPLERPKSGSVGPPLDGVEVRIDSPDGEGVGEVTVRGGNVMKEYWKNPEATAAALRSGWLHTGDLGMLDKDGYLTLVGRKKHIIVTAGGKNIHPESVEAKLNRSPFILESMVLSVPDRKGNERVAAIIVPDYDTLGGLRAELTEEGIRKTIADEINKACSELPDYKRIVEFQIRDEELPKTPTRKVKRHLVTWIKE
ncbi:MAG TPA: long-chain fatty acid--CoA ligase [Candidatus Eisenbacteria bacterium]|uniref:Long-chain fatty acid--CoA ligase n=1 Tax=Eiseniibacteriota bacterium TaxID=2212470 RepID=A0A7V2AW50_UNCEI|nr:long-chain fatty acid--CoA ligase [Candidatus Eisenbacteria bacterium]